MTPKTNLATNLAYQKAPGVSGGSYTENKLQAIQLPNLKGKRFLDLGCNAGFYCGHARAQGARRVVGIDSDPKVIQVARELYPDVEFHDTGWDQFPGEEFDIIICLSAIHYAHDLNALASNIRSHLASNGTFILEGGLIDVDGDCITDIPIPVWRKVGDRCRHLSRGFLERHLLREFEWKIVGSSEVRAGDPIPRVVIHATPGKKRAPERTYQLDLLAYVRCLKASAETIVPAMSSYEYISRLGRCSVIREEDLQTIFSSSDTCAAFADDLAFALSTQRPASLKLCSSLPAAVLDPLISALREKNINVDSPAFGCKPMKEYIPKLATLPNNQRHGVVAGKVVADLGIGDPGLVSALFEHGAKLCYVVGKDTSQSDDPRIVRVPTQPWDAPIEGVDVAFFDARAISSFDHVHDLTLLMERVSRILAPDGVLFAILESGEVNSEMDVFNSIVLTPNGAMPSSIYLFESLLKDYAVLVLDHPAKRLPGVTSRLLRITPKKPSLLLIFARSQAGKTSLAREFKSYERHAHVSNDHVFVELVRLKKMGRVSHLPSEVVNLVSEGGATNCGRFNRAIEEDDDLLKKYLGIVKSLIPVDKRLVTIDLDLRREEQYAVAKDFFTSAGYSVWIVTR
jgi:SAM-dependent methyltransferase